MINPDEIKDSNDLQLFINQLIQDFQNNNSVWENVDLPHFLKAMEACLHDYEKTDEERQISDTTNPWQAVAKALIMGKSYE